MIDYHIHLERGPLTMEWLQKFWHQAQRRGVTEIGITEHTHHFAEFWPAFRHLTTGSDAYPYMQEWLSQEFQHSLENYFLFLDKAKEAGIPLKIGLEVDYFPETEEIIGQELAKWPFDFLIGSVHVLGKWGFDVGSEHGWMDRDITEAYRSYYRTLAQAAASGLFDVIGHFDVIKVFGHRPSESVTADEDRALQAVKSHDVAIEVSTAGLRKPVQEIYPAESILQRAADLQIPITISSDAHEPEDVGYQWENAVIATRRAGYREYRIFSQRKGLAEKLPK